MTEKANGSKLKFRIYLTLTVIFLVGLIAAVTAIVRHYGSYDDATDLYTDLAASTYVSPAPTEKTTGTEGTSGGREVGVGTDNGDKDTTGQGASSDTGTSSDDRGSGPSDSGSTETASGPQTSGSTSDAEDTSDTSGTSGSLPDQSDPSADHGEDESGRQSGDVSEHTATGSGDASEHTSGGSDDGRTDTAGSSTGSEQETSKVSLMEELGVTIPARSFDWDALYEVNEDIYAWIYVPGTQVDYPIVQSPRSSDYYLDHNLDGSYGYPSCIYTEYLNHKDFNDYNTIIYGHNMTNGTMFGSLHSYEDSEFFDRYQFVYIYTPDREEPFVYRIYAAVTFSTDHLLKAYKYYKASSFEQFYEDLRSARGMTNQIREDMDPTTDERLVTLSTCVSYKNNVRYLVVGVLINR